MTRRIISASRRTDIAAYYSRWFLRRLEAGFCEWVHPFGGQVSRVSLRPEDCLALVFWTRNPGPLLPVLGDLRKAGYVFYFHVTLTGYPRALETRGPGLATALGRLRALAERAGPEAVLWRYDPIVLGSATPREFHLERFARIAREAAGATRRVLFSFVSFYGKTRRNLKRLAEEGGIRCEEPGIEEKRELALRLGDIADGRGMTLAACCEDDLVGDGILKARCVDLELVRRLRPDVEEDLARRPTRRACGCTESVDIGAYDTCPMGCVYCYATRSREIARARLAAHDPAAPALWLPGTRRAEPASGGGTAAKEASEPEEAGPDPDLLPGPSVALPGTDAAR